MKNLVNKSLISALSFLFVMAFSPITNATENPFGMSNTSSGTNLQVAGKCGSSHMKESDGKCGGAKKAEDKKGKCGDSMKTEGKKGKCGDSMKTEGKKGKCGSSMKTEGKKGKCGEGKCGGK